MTNKLFAPLIISQVDGPTEMEQLGRQLSRDCPAGTRLHLQGNLGAGKTTLVRGFLRGLDYQGKVKSPTFTLIEPYELAGVTVYHFDLYRLNDPLELEAIGLRDYFDGEGICLFEWPEKAEDLLGKPDVLIRIAIMDDSREVTLQAMTARGTHLLQAF